MDILIPDHLLTRVKKNPNRLVTVSSKRGVSLCPRQFRYSLSYPPSDTRSLKLGSEIHELLAHLYAGGNSTGLLVDWVKHWETLVLVPVFSPEQPFLVEYPLSRKTYIVGGVIDLIVKDPQNRAWVLDHKVSTGWVMSALAPLASQEQLAVYAWALRQHGFDTAGGIISQVFHIPDSGHVYARSIAKGEGVDEDLNGAWGIITKGKDHTRAILHDGTNTLHIERTTYPLTHEAQDASVNDLVTTWDRMRDTGVRITGKHCAYCPAYTRCVEDYHAGISPPPLLKNQLHHEFFSRIKP